MRVLQQLFESVIAEQFSFGKVGANLIKKKLKDLGVTVTEEQLAEMEARLQSLEGNTLTLAIDDSQLLPSLTDTVGDSTRVEIDLTNADAEIEGLVEQFSRDLPKLITEVVSEVSNLLLKSLQSSATSLLKQRRMERTSFENRLMTVWRKPLNLLEVFLQVAFEAGDEFNREFRAQASTKQDYLFDVLTRLHSRGCQIASEILTLLKSGHADGAHARWRSLHEVAVVAMFIKSAGNKTAEKYILHEIIESRKAARQYQKYHPRLGYEPMPKDELDQIESQCQQLIKRFGSEYSREYGWAAPLGKIKNPCFSDIERHVALDHLRPFYKLASHNVHANPKGVFFKLGLYPETGDILLAGPSNTGLADPAHGTAISLTQISVALFTTRSSIDSLVMCHILTMLERRIGQEFLLAQKMLERGDSDDVPLRVRPRKRE